MSKSKTGARATGKPFKSSPETTALASLAAKRRWEKVRDAKAAKAAQEREEAAQKARAVESARQAVRDLGFTPPPMPAAAPEPAPAPRIVPDPPRPRIISEPRPTVNGVEYDSARHWRLCPAGCGLKIVTDRVESLDYVVKLHLGEIMDSAPRCRAVRQARGWM